MNLKVEAVIKQTQYSIDAEITNVSGLIGERYIKLYPNGEADPTPSYIVAGTSVETRKDNFIGISFSCSLNGFIIYFSSSFREVQLAKQDKIHLFFENHDRMSFSMYSGKINFGPHNVNLAYLDPVQLACFCDNKVLYAIGENGRTGVQIKVSFVPGYTNNQYEVPEHGQRLLMDAARIIGTTQRNLNSLR